MMEQSEHCMKEFDRIEKLGKSTIHHGACNNRIYLMSLDTSDLPGIKEQLEAIAMEHGYTKIFAKVPFHAKDSFIEAEYEEEAYIPNFYHGNEDGFFLAKYLDNRRKTDPFLEENKKNIKMLVEEQSIVSKRDFKRESLFLEKDYHFRIAKEADANDMAELYQRVFPTYPFPIHESEYIIKTMKENVIYTGIWHKEKLVALSSMEIAECYSNVEMTDFATRNDYRGKGFASFLLNKMESVMIERGIRTAYTIARSKSYGMNKVFSEHDYCYAGTLINNTDIHGEIESMNVWYKPLIKQSKM